MNVNDFKRVLYNNFQKLILFTCIGGISLGVASSLFPKSFISEGSFILLPIFSDVSKSSSTQYNYDGYYIDQITQSYSKTIIGIIDTPEFKKRTSDSLNIEVNFINLFSFNLNNNFKEIAPRILVLTVKDTSKSLVEKKFEIFSTEIINYSNKYNKENKFKLERLDNFVFTYENTNSNYFFYLVGSFLSFSIYLTFLYLKTYLKDIKK